MANRTQGNSPNARQILNEIMILLFTPEAAISKGISTEQVATVVVQFANAAKSDVTTVKCLISKLVAQLDILENRIELREIEDSERAFKAKLEAQERRQRAMDLRRTEQLRHEGQENLRKWFVIDREVVQQRIKTKDLLLLSEFLAARGVSKRTVSNAMARGVMFCINGPDGQEYYPAFFADSNNFIRNCLGKVCQTLGHIPAFAKYQFLTTDSHWIENGGTPIDAIRSGRVDDVLQASGWLL